MKKPTKKFNSLDSLYKWVQRQFDNAGKSETIAIIGGKSKIKAVYEVECLYDCNSDDWATLIKKTQATDNFREVIDGEIECSEPVAIGVTITNTETNEVSGFMCCKLTDEHITLFDGKPVTEKVVSAGKKQEESENEALAGFYGNETNRKFAELDKENQRYKYENQIDLLKLRHENEITNKEREIKELNEKVAKLEKENKELQDENDELYKQGEKAVQQIKNLEDSNNNDTKMIAISAFRDFLNSKGVQTTGLNGYLESQQSQSEQMALPEVQMETAQVPQVDEKALAISAWLDRLPEITKAEMWEIMKKVELKPILSRKLLNYIYELARKIREKKQAQAQQNVVATAIPQPQQQEPAPAQPVYPTDETEETEETEENYEDNNFDEEEESYATI